MPTVQWDNTITCINAACGWLIIVNLDVYQITGVVLACGVLVESCCLWTETIDVISSQVDFHASKWIRMLQACHRTWEGRTSQC